MCFAGRHTGHTSKHAFPKCKTIGTYYVTPGKKGRVVFPDNNAPLRKHEDFMTEDNSAHHTNITIIADLQMDSVDYMHLTCLGVMRKLICYWAKRDTVNHLIGKMQQRPFQTDY